MTLSLFDVHMYFFFLCFSVCQQLSFISSPCEQLLPDSMRLNLKARHYRQNHRFLFVFSCTGQFEVLGYFASITSLLDYWKETSKCTFKYLFYCTLSILACIFQLQYISLKAVFSKWVFSSTSAVLTYTKTCSFIPVCILKIFTEGFIHRSFMLISITFYS